MAERTRSIGFTAVAVAVLLGVGGLVIRAALSPAPAQILPADGAELWTAGRNAGAVLVLDGQARASPLLEGLRRAGVRRLALLVIITATTRRGSYEAITAVIGRYQPPVVIAPARLAATMTEVTAGQAGASYRVGDVVVVLDTVTPERIEVREVARAPPWSLTGSGRTRRPSNPR